MTTSVAVLQSWLGIARTLLLLTMAGTGCLFHLMFGTGEEWNLLLRGVEASSVGLALVVTTESVLTRWMVDPSCPSDKLSVGVLMPLATGLAAWHLTGVMLLGVHHDPLWLVALAFFSWVVQRRGVPPETKEVRICSLLVAGWTMMRAADVSFGLTHPSIRWGAGMLVAWTMGVVVLRRGRGPVWLTSASWLSIALVLLADPGLSPTFRCLMADGAAVCDTVRK